MGSQQLWLPLEARSAMLGGAELLIVPVHQGGTAAAARSNTLEDGALLTRGFENAMAVVRVNHGEPRGAGRSGMANWCNDMIPDGCAAGSQLLALAGPAPEVVRASFSIQDLRAQRGNGIWGDAFRHPFEYQELCGFNDELIMHAICDNSTGNIAHARFVQENGDGTSNAEHKMEAAKGNAEQTVRSEEGNIQQNVHVQLRRAAHSASDGAVKVALLQMEPCPTNANCTATVADLIQRIAQEGADIALTPEMFSVGYPPSP